MTDRRQNDPRHIAAALSFMSDVRAADDTDVLPPASRCRARGCKRVTLRTYCDRHARDGLPPRAA